MRRTVGKPAVAIPLQPAQDRPLVFQPLGIKYALRRGQSGGLVEEIGEWNAACGRMRGGLAEGKPAGLGLTEDTDRNQTLRNAEHARRLPIRHSPFIDDTSAPADKQGRLPMCRRVGRGPGQHRVVRTEDRHGQTRRRHDEEKQTHHPPPAR